MVRYSLTSYSNIGKFIRELYSVASYMNILMSGNFTLCAELHGKFFTDEQEPQSWDDNFSNLYKNYFDGKNLVIDELDYYYNKEKKSRKMIKQLDEVLSFITDDPHIGNKSLFVDVRKDKPKIVNVINLDEKDNDFPQAIKDPEKKHHKRKKKSNKIKVVKVKRV